MTHTLSTTPIAPLDLQPHHALAAIECRMSKKEIWKGRSKKDPLTHLATTFLAQAGHIPEKIVKLSKAAVEDMRQVQKGIKRSRSTIRRLHEAMREYRVLDTWIHAKDREISLDLVCEALETDPDVFQKAFLNALPKNDRHMALNLTPWTCPLCLQVKREQDT